MNGRNGVSVAEALLALTLTVVFSGALVGLLLNAWSTSTFEMNRMTVSQTLRHGARFLSDEWSGLSTHQGDILAMGTTYVRYRGSRGLAILCAVRAGALTVRTDHRYGVRAWQPGRDSLMVFAVGDSLLTLPERWVPLPLVAVGTGSCWDGSSGISLATIIDPMRLSIGEIVLGAPVRVFEPMEVRLYPSLGTHWLGVRSLSTGGNIEPALGPLTANGLELGFLDSSGATTMDPMRVAGVEATLRGHTGLPVRRGVGPRQLLSDSLFFTVTARNR